MAALNERTAPPVAAIMQRALITTHPLQLLSEAQEIMKREGIRQLPVLDNGALIGLLSKSDLQAHSGYLGKTKVDAAMSTDLITAHPDDDAACIARLLLEKKLNALPVVDSGRLIGIVSRTDLLKLLLRLFE